MICVCGVCGVDVCDCGGVDGCVCFVPEKRELTQLYTDFIFFEVDVGICFVFILIVFSVTPVSLPNASAV